MARMSLKKAFDAFMDAELAERIKHVKSGYYDGDVLKAGATIEEVTEHINRVKSSHANIFKNAEDLRAKQEGFLNKILNGPKGKKAFINGESYAIYGSLKRGESYPSIMPTGDNVREGVLMYDTETWFKGTRNTGKPIGRFDASITNTNNFINNPNIEIETDGDAIDDIKATRRRAQEAAKNGSPSKIINDRNTLDEVLGKKSFSAPNLSRANNKGPLRPNTVMNGNSSDIDSIYNHSVPKSVNKDWGHTSSGQDLERQQQQHQQQQQQRTINMEDPSSWTDDDIREMAQGDPEHAQELINQRNAARNQQQQQQQQQQQKINQRNIENDGPVNIDQTVDRHGETPSETVDKHNSNAPDPNTSTQTVNNSANDWRKKIKDQQRAQRGVNKLSIDESTAKAKVDTSDPYHIYKTTTDAQGNTRIQRWSKAKTKNGYAKLVSDITHNNEATYNNITGEYIGPDRSPIDWINADEWNDDYIINRAGDDEKLLNSMMNARERKIQEQQRRAATVNKDATAHAEETAQASSSTGPKAFDPDDPTTWTDADIANMADGDPDLYQELINQRSQATGGNTTGNGPDVESNNVPDYEPEIDPMEDPLNWTDDYIEEISEGDPAYYEQLNRQRQQAIYADKYKNVDPSNPTSWTDDYIKDTALNQEEFDWMTDKMRKAKNLDLVDELNRQRRSQSEPIINRQQRRQQQKDNRQKGNQQKKKTKKEKERDKRRRKFEDRQRAMGNDPDEQRRINREANEQRRQQRQNEEPKVNRGNQQNENKNKNKNKNNYDIPDEAIDDAVDAADDALDAANDAVDAAKGADDVVDGVAKFGKLDMVMSAVNVLGAVGDYKAERRKGRGVVASAITAGAKFAVFEALGAWALPVQLVSALPGMAIKGADMLYKENRRMNSSANFQVFGDAQFMDTQQLATMRQSGMEMAKMAQYNLQQTLMGNEATYLHR